MNTVVECTATEHWKIAMLQRISEVHRYNAVVHHTHTNMDIATTRLSGPEG